MMTKPIILWIVVLLSFSLSSCIELLEEISINEDKSGTVFIGVESKLLGSLLGIAKDQVDPSVLEAVEKFPNDSKKKLINVKGISKIRSFDQLNSGRIGIRFQFDNSKALNSAYYALMDIEKKWYNPSIVCIGKHQIKRRDLTPHLVNYLDSEKPGIKDADFIKYISYKTVIKTPFPTKKVENEKVNGNVGTKRVSINYKASEILKDEKSTAFKIRF